MNQPRAEVRLAARRAPIALALLAALALACALALLASSAPPAGAVVLRVQPDSASVWPNTYETILAANAVAVFGDSIEVSAVGDSTTPGVYTHDTVLTLTDGVVYRGGFGPDWEGPNASLYETTIALAEGSDNSVIDCSGTSSSTVLAGFTITGGQALFSGGGIFCGGAGSEPLIRNCEIRGNTSEDRGGGIGVGADASPRIVSCRIRENSARLRGGGIFLAVRSDGTSIEFSSVAQCTSGLGGQAGAGGGGIATVSGALITSTHIDSCWTGNNGGGVLAISGASPQLHSVWMRGNRAVNRGGAVYADGGAGEIRASQIEESWAGFSGGALYASGGTWRVEDSFLRFNTADSDSGGGALYFDLSEGALVARNEISGNTAAAGSAIRVVGHPFRSILSVQIESNTIACNTTTGATGGALEFGPAGNFADLVFNNIISHQQDGSAVTCFGSLNQPTLRFNCVWHDTADNSDPVYGGDCDDRSGINGNIKRDPLYCNYTTGAPTVPICDLLGTGEPPFYLSDFSPCVGAGEGGGDMGAFPPVTACDSTAVVHTEPMSWGQLKAAYR